MNRFQMKPPEGEPESATVQESPDLFDYTKIKDYALFILGAAKRHKLIVTVIYTLVLVATGALLWALPRTYHVETKLLGQRNQVIASLAVPSRAMPGEADAPARAAGELIKSRASLLTLMDQTDLVNHFYQHRAPGGAIKDWVLSRLGKVPSDADKREAILGMLDQRLWVTLSTSWQAEGTVTIDVAWPDPKMAFRLANEAQRNFLEARSGTELTTIGDAIAILEGYAATYRREVVVAADELEAARAEKAIRAGHPPARPRLRRLPVVNPELAQLKSKIEGLQRTINDLEEIRQGRLTGLKNRLEELKTTYAEGHPKMLEQRENLRAASVESPQIALLRKDLAEYKSEYEQLGGPNEDILDAAPLSPEIAQIQAAPREEDSGEEYMKRYDLRRAVSRYGGLLERIDSAKIELDTARAAFKYRYNVLRPPMLPTQPTKPAVVRIWVAGAIAALFLALFAAVAMDIWSREIFERWQVERQLKLPVLSELPWP